MKKTSETYGILDSLFAILPMIREYHAPNTPLYGMLKSIARKEIERLFCKKIAHNIEFGPFGVLTFPYHAMGTIDSLDLFDIDELIILSFYWKNRARYKKVLDIGANLGLHSIVLSKCGYKITCYEPDPVHFKILKENIALNKAHKIQCNNMAVSEEDGNTEFVRVLGNTTGSHILGAKKDPYGELEKISVKTKSFKSILNAGYDLIKMDVEGYEKVIIAMTNRFDWKKTDGVLSVHGKDNAVVLFKHFRKLGINMFSQKINWHTVSKLNDMPMSHHEGSLFVTSKNSMPWH
jgi:FkbM family methyltransferase